MSNPPCPHTIPQYYVYSLNAIGYASTAINTLGLYLVWFQSPTMSHYKYCLANVQFITIYSELHISYVAPAYYFFPALAGINISERFLRYFTPHQSLVFWLFIFSSELPALSICFIYRNHSAKGLTQRHVSSISADRVIFLVITHIFPFFVSFAMAMSSLTSEQQYISLSQNYPQCLFYLSYKGFTMYDHHLNPWVAYVGFISLTFVLVASAYCIILTIQTINILKQMRQHMSEQTYKMQKTAIRSLIMQCVIPVTFLLIPLYFVLVVVSNNIMEYQAIATHTTFFLTSHSMASTVVMIVTIPKYREFIISKIFVFPAFYQSVVRLLNPHQYSTEQ